MAGLTPWNWILIERVLKTRNYADVKSMITKNLVSGLKLESNTAPDPICVTGWYSARYRASRGSRLSRP